MSLSKSLKLDLPALAEMIRSKGRGKDTILAHITPKEAALLKRRGGSGTTNPDTGLPEFQDEYDFGSMDIGFGPGEYYAPATQADIQGTTFTPEQNEMYGYSQPATTQQFAATQDAEDLAGGQYAGPVPVGQPLPTGGTAYAPTTLTPIQLGQAAVGQQVEGYPGPKAEAGPQTKDISTQLKEALTPGNLARLGLVGALGTYGASVARKGAGQTQAAAAQQQAIAQPYTEQGKQLVAQAQRGELTPQSQQALEAAKAQIAQSTATRGGVGQQQAANQIANLYQTLLNNQYTYGLNVMNIGDQISLGAIRTGLQLDQQMQQSTTNFYSQLAALAAGGTGQQPQIVRVVQ
jgi:hypothetical protein